MVQLTTDSETKFSTMIVRVVLAGGHQGDISAPGSNVILASSSRPLGTQAVSVDLVLADPSLDTLAQALSQVARTSQAKSLSVVSISGTMPAESEAWTKLERGMRVPERIGGDAPQRKFEQLQRLIHRRLEDVELREIPHGVLFDCRQSSAAEMEELWTKVRPNLSLSNSMGISVGILL